MYLVLPKINKKEYHIFLFFFKQLWDRFRADVQLGGHQSSSPKLTLLSAVLSLIK